MRKEILVEVYKALVRQKKCFAHSDTVTIVNSSELYISKLFERIDFKFSGHTQICDDVHINLHELIIPHSTHISKYHTDTRGW